MEIENELKQILQQAYKDASVDEFLGVWGFEYWHKKYSSKILALGKPEPLAKNKQCGDDFKCPKDKSICERKGTYYCSRLCDLM